MYTVNRKLPHVLVPQSLAPLGKRIYELKPFELGIMDCETQRTVDIGSYCLGNTYEIVMGSPSTGDKNPFFRDLAGSSLAIKSLPITRIISSHVYEKEGSGEQKFVAYLGYDGISDCKTLNLECGASYGLRITARGESVRNVFNRNMTEIIPFDTPCCDDCATDSACTASVEAMYEAIKKASFYVKNYFDVGIVKSCCTTADPFDKTLCKTFTLEVCDDGSTRALAKVQSQYPDMDVERVSRDNPYSTYKVLVKSAITLPSDDATILDGTAWDAITAPADFTLTRTNHLVCDECPTCPSGFTKVDAGDSVLVCFNSAAGAQVTTLEEFDVDYYADPVAAKATVQTLVDAAGALVPGFIAGTVKLVGSDCDKVTIQVCVTEGTDLKEHGLTDAVITSVGTCKGYCKGEATLSWCPMDNLYAINRTLCLTKKGDDCGLNAADELAALQDQYKDQSDVVSIEVDKATECLISFKLVQCSNCVQDGCDISGADGAKFGAVDAFDGMFWKMCDCEGWTVDVDGCPVAPVATIDECQCGLKFEGKFIDYETMECFDDIHDHIEREPIELEIQVIKQYQDDPQCDAFDIPWTVVQYGKPAEGFGRNVGKREVLSRGYRMQPYFSPRSEYGGLLNARLGIDYGFKANAFYNMIALDHKYATEGQSWDSAAHGTTRETIEIYVDRKDVEFMQELKDFFNKTLLQNGTCKLLK